MRAVMLLLLGAVACAPRAMAVSADHPANPDAETGRLAGPPAALRPGVVADRDIQPPARSPAPMTPSTPHEHPVDAKPVEPPAEKPAEKPEKPVPKKPPAAKPAPKPAPPVEKPAPKKPPAPVEKPAEKPAPPKPVPPTGHEGHH